MKKYRWLLTVMLLSLLLLNGCGGSGGGGQAAATPANSGEPTSAASEEKTATPTPAKEDATTEEKVAPTSESAASGLDKELSVYNWADYIEQAVLDDYTKQYGVKIVYDTYASNEDLLAKLQAGATGYDVIIPSDYMVGQMIELGLLAQIDPSNIPNLKNIDPFFLNLYYDPGNKHCVPYLWGTSGIAYSKKFFGDKFPDSWAYIFDPKLAEQWSKAGGINVLNDQRELIGDALKYLGYSLNDTNEEHLQQAKEVILKVKPFIKTFNSEDYDESLLVTHEVIISQAWSGDAAQAASKTVDEATGESDWAYVVPKEGAFIFQDNVCIPASSQRQATAQHFLNYMLEAKVAAANTNYVYYPNPNKTAEALINPDILSDPSIYPPKEVQDKLEWGKPLGEAVFLYDQIWTEIKSQ
ncbi:MAG: spermidine/putrescine ABC transporter substrate-binding protein [Anaerolineae bacterium]